MSTTTVDPAGDTAAYPKGEADDRVPAELALEKASADGSDVPLRFRVREPNWWVATDRGGQWHICRHGDGYFHYGWRGVVDGKAECADLGSWHRRADALTMIEDLRPGITQLVRDRRAKHLAALQLVP